jgi:hypothetical protein
VFYDTYGLPIVSRNLHVEVRIWTGGIFWGSGLQPQTEAGGRVTTTLNPYQTHKFLHLVIPHRDIDVGFFMEEKNTPTYPTDLTYKQTGYGGYRR